MNNTYKNHQFDIIIIGAGLIGLTLARLLAPSQYKILIIDRTPKPSAIDCPNPFGRIHAYNLSTQKILKDISIWQQIHNQHLSPFKAMQVLAQHDAKGLDLEAQSLNLSHLGHFIAGHKVIDVLIQELENDENIHFSWETSLGQFNQLADHIELLTDAKSLSAKIVIGADGARSWLKRQLPIQSMTFPYNQHCIVGFVKFKGDHQYTAWQRFLPTGPLGLLPLNDNYYSLAWSLDFAIAEQYMKQPEDQFLETLFNQQLPRGIKQLTSITHRQYFPLQAHHVKQYSHQRAVLVGDAAHVIHPLAGLGMNLGMKDAHSLANAILSDPKILQNPSKAFASYQKNRLHQNAQILHTMTAFYQLFKQQSTPAKWVQKQLLAIANQQDFIKIILGYTATELNQTKIIQHLMDK